MPVLFAYLAKDLKKTETTAELADIPSEQDERTSKHNQTIDQPHLARQVPQSNCQLNSREDLHFDFLAHFHTSSLNKKTLNQRLFYREKGTRRPGIPRVQRKYPLSQDRLQLYRHLLGCPKALVVSFRSIP